MWSVNFPRRMPAKRWRRLPPRRTPSAGGLCRRRSSSSTYWTLPDTRSSVAKLNWGTCSHRRGQDLARGGRRSHARRQHLQVLRGRSPADHGGCPRFSAASVSVEVTREPVGVVGLITPWNFPMAIPAWKLAPALAYGNSVVLKPADLVPASAWALADILQRAGLPAGV